MTSLPDTKGARRGDERGSRPRSNVSKRLAALPSLAEEHWASVSPISFVRRALTICVEFATDIAAIHGPGSKKITLIHSRPHLLNRFETYMHDGAMEKLEQLQIDVVLGARVDMKHLESRRADHGVERVIKTLDGREFEADLVVRPLISA